MEYETISRLLDEGWTIPLGMHDHGRSLYHCEKCGSWTAKPWAKLVRGEEHFEPTYRCGKCRRPLVRVGHDDLIDEYVRRAACPRCGQKQLIFCTDVSVIN